MHEKGTPIRFSSIQFFPRTHEADMITKIVYEVFPFCDEALAEQHPPVQMCTLLQTDTSKYDPCSKNSCIESGLSTLCTFTYYVVWVALPGTTLHRFGWTLTIQPQDEALHINMVSIPRSFVCNNLVPATGFCFRQNRVRCYQVDLNFFPLVRGETLCESVDGSLRAVG